MFIRIINYAVRGLIILIGLFFLSGIIVPEGADRTLYTVCGLVFTLFGIYRIALYRSKEKRYYSSHYKDES